MIRVRLGCDSSSRARGGQCPSFEADISEGELAEWPAKTTAEHGWTAAEGKHFCPAHNPADAGEMVTITSAEYTTLAPGCEVRLPNSLYRVGDVGIVELEVRREQAGAEADR